MAILTEQIDGIEWVKYDWNGYKLNAADCGPVLAISGDGLVAVYYCKGIRGKKI